MNRSEQERTRIVRAWLGEGSTELSQRVLDGVLRTLPATAQDRPFGSSWRSRMSAVAAVAAAAVVIVVIASIRPPGGGVPGGAGPTAVPTHFETPSQIPQPIDRSYREVGFIGLPPPGAVPSSPGAADLVEGFWLTRNSGAGYRGGVFVYADGRMIWNEYWPTAEGSSTGWLEQRLTADGIELVRGMAIDTGEPGAARRLDPALLPSRLPAGAWADPTVRPYVPTQFAVCLVVNNWSTAYWPGVPQEVTSLTLNDRLALLPEALRDFLSDRERTWLLPATVSTYGDEPCFAMSTADARLLDAGLSDAGLVQDTSRNRYLLEYHVKIDGSGPESLWLGVWFEPILPDGTITCSSCG